jgi:hypothetical protein
VKELSESDSYLDGIMREFEEIWNWLKHDPNSSNEANKQYWLKHDPNSSNKAKKQLKKLRKRFDKIPQLKMNESLYLINLGKQSISMGKEYSLWDLAYLYAKGLGNIPEEHPFDSGCNLEIESTLYSEVQLIAHAVQPLLEPNENLIYHDRLKAKYGGPYDRQSHIFLTNRRIFLLGPIDSTMRHKAGHVLPIYKTSRGLWRPIHYDLIDLDKIHTVRLQGEKTQVYYECDYEYTVDQTATHTDRARGGKMVIFQTTGHLDLEFTMEKCRPLTIPKEKPYPDRDRKKRARELHDRIIVASGGTIKATGDFDEATGGRLECPFCNSTYRYSPSSVQPDRSIKCQNCMKLFKIV